MLNFEGGSMEGAVGLFIIFYGRRARRAMLFASAKPHKREITLRVTPPAFSYFKIPVDLITAGPWGRL
jgi:hypothetical protein